MTSARRSQATENHEEDGNIPFYINKSGFPIDQHTWERMWNYAGRLYPEGKEKINEIRNRSDHRDVSSLNNV